MDLDLDTIPQNAPRSRPAITQSASRVLSPTHLSPSLAASHPPSHVHGNSVSHNNTLMGPSDSAAERNQRHKHPSTSSRQPQPPPLSSDDDDLEYLPTLSPPQSTRLPSLPQLSNRRHAQLKAIQTLVNKEKQRFHKSEDRKIHLSQVRRVFADYFKAPEDEDFYSVHTAAPREAVDSYLDRSGPGPNTADLHFTDREPYNNAWNRAISAHLAQVLWNRQKTEQWTTQRGMVAAAGSEAYWDDAILSKFSRVRPGWIKARCQPIKDPTTGKARMESREEADTRRLNAGEEVHIIGRQRERRYKVSWNPVF